MPIRRATPLDLSLLIGTMLIWALAFIGMKISVVDLGPFWLAASRAVLGFLTVIPFAVWSGLKLPQGKTQWRYMIILVIFNVTIPIILISWAMKTLNAGIAALIMGSGPFMALFIGHFFTRDERFTLFRLIGVLMGFSGIVAIVGYDAVTGLSFANLLAQGALLLASLMYVIAGFTIRKIELPPLSIAAVSLFLGLATLIPIALFMTGSVPTNVSDEALYWILFTGIAGTGLGFISRFYLVQTIGYSLFAIGVNMIPVFGVLLGAVILNEMITVSTVLALVLVVGGLFVARLGNPAQL